MFCGEVSLNDKPEIRHSTSSIWFNNQTVKCSMKRFLLKHELLRSVATVGSRKGVKLRAEASAAGVEKKRGDDSYRNILERLNSAHQGVQVVVRTFKYRKHLRPNL